MKNLRQLAEEAGLWSAPIWGDELKVFSLLLLEQAFQEHAAGRKVKSALESDDSLTSAAPPTPSQS